MCSIRARDSARSSISRSRRAPLSRCSKRVWPRSTVFRLDVLVFLEDQDDPIADLVEIAEHATRQGLKVHLHCHRRVKVTVTFNGKTVERHFGPSATVARVKRWAAEREFGMSSEEAGEHVLQIAGTHDRPSPGTHIGALADGRVRLVAFDLVPDERVQGASWRLA